LIAQAERCDKFNKGILPQMKIFDRPFNLCAGDTLFTDLFFSLAIAQSKAEK